MMRYLIKQIEILNNDHHFQKKEFLSITKGKLKEHSNNDLLNEKLKYEIIDGQGCIFLPVVTDLYADLKTPGQEYKSILDQEISAATAGGITTVCCQPDTDPVLDEPSLIKDLITKANKVFPINIKPIAAITKDLEGQHIAEMKELYDAGAIGFSQAEKSIINTKVLLRAFEYAKTFGFTLFLRASENFLTENTFANESAIATRLGIRGSNKNAEVIEVLKYIALSKEIGTKIHLSKISCRESLEIIARAKNENINVSCDVSINQLLFTDQDIDLYNSNYHLSPPLRSKSDQDSILESIELNIIDAVCSDHRPVEDDKKRLPFEESEKGASSFETFIPLIFKAAKIHRLNLEHLLSKISYSPYKIVYGERYDYLNNKNTDFCIYNKSQNWVASPNELKSSGKNVPFNWELEGRVTHTFIDGIKIYQL